MEYKRFTSKPVAHGNTGSYTGICNQIKALGGRVSEAVRTYIRTEGVGPASTKPLANNVNTRSACQLPPINGNVSVKEGIHLNGNILDRFAEWKSRTRSGIKEEGMKPTTEVAEKKCLDNEKPTRDIPAQKRNPVKLQTLKIEQRAQEAVVRGKGPHRTRKSDCENQEPHPVDDKQVITKAVRGSNKSQRITTRKQAKTLSCHDPDELNKRTIDELQAGSLKKSTTGNTVNNRSAVQLPPINKGFHVTQKEVNKGSASDGNIQSKYAEQKSRTRQACNYFNERKKDMIPSGEPVQKKRPQNKLMNVERHHHLDEVSAKDLPAKQLNCVRPTRSSKTNRTRKVEHQEKVSDRVCSKNKRPVTNGPANQKLPINKKDTKKPSLKQESQKNKTAYLSSRNQSNDIECSLPKKNPKNIQFEFQSNNKMRCQTFSQIASASCQSADHEQTVTWMSSTNTTNSKARKTHVTINVPPTEDQSPKKKHTKLTPEVLLSEFNLNRIQDWVKGISNEPMGELDELDELGEPLIPPCSNTWSQASFSRPDTLSRCSTTQSEMLVDLIAEGLGICGETRSISATMRTIEADEQALLVETPSPREQASPSNLTLNSSWSSDSGWSASTADDGCEHSINAHQNCKTSQKQHRIQTPSRLDAECTTQSAQHPKCDRHSSESVCYSSKTKVRSSITQNVSFKSCSTRSDKSSIRPNACTPRSGVHSVSSDGCSTLAYTVSSKACSTRSGEHSSRSNACSSRSDVYSSDGCSTVADVSSNDCSTKSDGCSSRPNTCTSNSDVSSLPSNDRSTVADRFSSNNRSTRPDGHSTRSHTQSPRSDKSSLSSDRRSGESGRDWSYRSNASSSTTGSSPTTYSSVSSSSSTISKCHSRQSDYTTCTSTLSGGSPASSGSGSSRLKRQSQIPNREKSPSNRSDEETFLQQEKTIVPSRMSTKSLETTSTVPSRMSLRSCGYS